MGSPCAHSYANLYLGWWETSIVFGDNSPEGVDCVSLCSRYINDIFVVWQGSREQFLGYIENLNDNPLELRFTYNINQTSLAFLDVLIEKYPDGSLSTWVYRKPTATNSLLNWHSGHPMALKKGITRGQYLRLRRNCSSDQKFREQAIELRQRFTDRGYPDKVLRGSYKNVIKRARLSLLSPRPKEPDTAPLVL